MPVQKCRGHGSTVATIVVVVVVVVVVAAAVVVVVVIVATVEPWPGCFLTSIKAHTFYAQSMRREKKTTMRNLCADRSFVFASM